MSRFLWVWWALLVAVPSLSCFADVEPKPADPQLEKLDELQYKDGNRVTGHYVRKEDDELVFQSKRFGLIRVPVDEVVLVLANPPKTDSEAAALEAATVAKKEADSEAGWSFADLSPLAMARALKDFFGPWHGRLAFSTELVSDTTDRSAVSLDANIHRKWKKDEVQITGHYDYGATNNVKTVDNLKGSGLWRHDFNKWRFAQYRPTLEWDRASLLNGVPNNYVLLQQEIGVGFNLLVKPTKTIRTGVSENLFDVWNSAPTPNHSSRAVASVFEEIEYALPWRMTLSQRGMYYPVPGREDGWEDRIELNKKLTETFSVSVRHEIRVNNPDGSSQDYSRLKLLFGLDF
ncbi:MAG: DUF481 domain-containing protein [Verrucomicrobia bacterium]|nr:DUF481 domain-containing protein [Verrucomicrobiota bacterium]